MPVIKYKDPQTGGWVALGSGVLGTEIPFSENTPEKDNAWIDPVSESLKYKDPGTGIVKKVGVSKNEVYSKEETNTLLQKKADEVEVQELKLFGYISPELPNGVKNYIEGNVFHKRVGRVDLGALNWTYKSDFNYFDVPYNDVVTNPDDGIVYAICSRYAWGNVRDSSADKVFSNVGFNYNNQISVKDTDYTTVEAFRAAVSGVYVYYQKATEETYSILDTPSTITRVSNPNLLDNWYFGSPVDQRGGYVVVPTQDYYDTASTANSLGKIGGYYTANILNTTWATFVKDGTTYYAKTQYCVRGYTGAGYGIDRWRTHGNSTIIIGSDSLAFFAAGDANIVQPLENALKEDTLFTFSVLNKTGTVYIRIRDTEWGDYGGSQRTGDGVVSVTGTVPKGKIPMVQFYSSIGENIAVKAAKLELGDQQTLAHQENSVWVLNEIPDYGEQLRRCQRYYFKTGDVYTTGLSSSNTVKSSYISFPVTMRATPSLTLIAPCYIRQPNGSWIECDSRDVWVSNPNGFSAKLVNTQNAVVSQTVYEVAIQFTASADL